MRDVDRVAILVKQSVVEREKPIHELLEPMVKSSDRAKVVCLIHKIELSRWHNSIGLVQRWRLKSRLSWGAPWWPQLKRILFALPKITVKLNFLIFSSFNYFYLALRLFVFRLKYRLLYFLLVVGRFLKLYCEKGLRLYVSMMLGFLEYF